MYKNGWYFPVNTFELCKLFHFPNLFSATMQAEPFSLIPGSRALPEKILDRGREILGQYRAKRGPSIKANEQGNLEKACILLACDESSIPISDRDLGFKRNGRDILSKLLVSIKNCVTLRLRPPSLQSYLVQIGATQIPLSYVMKLAKEMQVKLITLGSPVTQKTRLECEFAACCLVLEALKVRSGISSIKNDRNYECVFTYK
jgi:hypothetical protein